MKSKQVSVTCLSVLLITTFCGYALAQSVITSFSTNAEQSGIRFSAEHAGMAFSGEFTQWQATVNLPPSESPSIEARFQLASAKTGDRTYDSTLPEADWFDIENYPTAVFNASDITQVSTNTYAIKGDLALKGNTHPVQFSLVRQEDDMLSAQFEIDRLKYMIGVESDPNAEWVSQMITIELELTTD